MDFSQFGATDILYFFGAYVIWCALAVPVWRWAGRRRLRSWRKSLLAGACFAPALCPVVREAFVLAPALPTLAMFAVLEILVMLRGEGFNCDAGLCWFVAATALSPLAIVAALHASASYAIAFMRRRRAGSG